MQCIFNCTYILMFKLKTEIHIWSYGTLLISSLKVFISDIYFWWNFAKLVYVQFIVMHVKYGKSSDYNL